MKIACLPGGPGLSSKTISPLENLRRFGFDVDFIDPPGTNGRPELELLNYESIAESIERALSHMPPFVLCGHSFGGIVATDLAVRKKLPLRALIVLAAPFSQGAFQEINAAFEKKMTPELRAAGELFEQFPTNDHFAHWLSLYGKIYFHHTQERGHQVLRNDRVSARSFLEAGEQMSHQGHLLDEINKLNLPKLFVQGADDALLPVSAAQDEALRGGFEFITLADAGHFLMFDQMEELNQTIAQWLATKEIK